MLSVALDAFTQQVTHTREIRTVVESEASIQVRRIYSFLNDSLPTPEKAVYGAFYDFEPLETVFSCPSGDCEWKPYQSLGVCHQCADIKDLVYFDESCFYNESSKCSLYLANSLFIDFGLKHHDYGPTDMTVMKTDTSVGLLGLERVGFSLVNITRLYLASASDWEFTLDEVWQCHHNSLYGASNVSTCVNMLRGLIRASECTLYWCIHQYEANVKTGRLTEAYLKSWWNSAPPNSSIYDSQAAKDYWVIPNFDWEVVEAIMQSSNPQNSTNVTSTPSAPLLLNYTYVEPHVFFVDNYSSSHISDWLSSFFNSTLTEDGLEDNTGIADSKLDDASLIYKSSQQLSTNSAIHEDRIPLIISTIAWSLTQMIRRSQNWEADDYIAIFQKEPRASGNITRSPADAFASGIAFKNTSLIEVRWQWLIFPAMLITMTVCLTLSTKIRTLRQGIPAWRSSTIPLMIHGPCSMTRPSSHQLDTVDQMERMARRTNVILQPTSRGWKLQKEDSSIKAEVSSSGRGSFAKTSTTEDLVSILKTSPASLAATPVRDINVLGKRARHS